MSLYLGNDLVDSTTPEAYNKYLDSRFIKRVFTREERFVIEKSAQPNTALWAVWAAKEAAFKAFQKMTPALIFAHQAFSITNETLSLLNEIPHLWEGTLRFKKLQGSFQCFIEADFIHCLCVVDKEQKNLFSAWDGVEYTVVPFARGPAFSLATLKQHFTRQELLSVSNKESLLTRFYAKQFLKDRGLEGRITIVRTPRETDAGRRYSPPAIFLNDKLSPHELSLSHDGRFAAIAFLGAMRHPSRNTFPFVR